MVDDFKVPNDTGYGFDSHGRNTLSLEYIHDELQFYKLHALFPSVSSSNESGWKRGCVIIVNEKLFDQISSIKKKLLNSSTKGILQDGKFLIFLFYFIKISLYYDDLFSNLYMI